MRSRMKYMIIHEINEPWEENYAKVLEIEKKRAKKGEGFTGKQMVTQMYISIATPNKTFWVVDCEPEDIIKWSKAYGTVMKSKIIPVMTRAEWAEQ